MTITERQLGALDALAGSPPPKGLLDDYALRELRRAILTAVAVPGYQVPFGSREMPVARGWGSGGLQVTLALVGADDVVKVIDQGDDEGVNAVNLRRLITSSTGADETTVPAEADIVQSRHRIPEDELGCSPKGADQVLVLQVPVPEPLRGVERDMRELARMHAEADYSKMWVSLYEDKVRNGVITQSTGYPCLVGGRYVIATTPIPRHDIPRLHRAAFLTLFGAGREKRVYAVPPDTDVEPLTFDDVPFEIEHTPGATCRHCGASDTYLVETPGRAESIWTCSDTDWCRRNGKGEGQSPSPMDPLRRGAPDGRQSPAVLRTEEPASVGSRHELPRGTSTTPLPTEGDVDV